MTKVRIIPSLQTLHAIQSNLDIRDFFFGSYGSLISRFDYKFNNKQVVWFCVTIKLIFFKKLETCRNWSPKKKIPVAILANCPWFKIKIRIDETNPRIISNGIIINQGKSSQENWKQMPINMRRLAIIIGI